MKKIQAIKILFIKLGRRGEFEEDCINKGYLKIGFNDIDHNDCISQKWDKVRAYFQKGNSEPYVVSSFINQIKKFYFEPETTLWITFYKNKMWWCFADKRVELLSDGTKIRRTINGWSDKNIAGKKLSTELLSGRLSKVQGWRGTICEVKEKDYCLNKINNEVSIEIAKTEKSLTELKENVLTLIKKLGWKDFEILVDMIFRQAGWQRSGVLGKTTKSIDLELLSPVTGETAAIQVKSQSNLKEFKKYVDDFSKMDQYVKFFYIVHSPSEDLKNYEISSSYTQINIYFGEKLSELVINSGLVDWLMRKIS